MSRKPWQDFIVNELVASVRRKGCDGLWLDNTDVYYEYHRESIYKGLLNIITRIHNKNIPIYINGGDEFVTRLINSGKKRLIKGVFQEEVLTSIISYSGNRFGRQNKGDRSYYEAYLRKVKRAGLKQRSWSIPGAHPCGMKSSNSAKRTSIPITFHRMFI